jgi:flavin-dependent dehydrogenase
MERFDLAVWGSGPVALLCAIAAARTQRTILLTRPFRSVSSIEAVPAELLGLLVEFGVHPLDMGATQILRNRLVAWEDGTPTNRDAPPAVHVDRAALERALLERAEASRGLVVRVALRPRLIPDVAGYQGPGFRASRLVDATGRASCSAVGKTRAATPWVATVWTFPTYDQAVRPELAIAAVPSGYAYRLAAGTTLTFGFVSPGTPVRDRGAVLDHLRSGGAEWIAEGIPWAQVSRQARRIASVQWTFKTGSQPETVVRIGDAALARDALSSQGLATGLSEALYAAAARHSKDVALLLHRQEEQRGAHLRALASSLAECRFRREPAWHGYAEWLATQTVAQTMTRVGLERGQLLRR